MGITSDMQSSRLCAKIDIRVQRVISLTLNISIALSMMFESAFILSASRFWDRDTLTLSVGLDQIEVEIAGAVGGCPPGNDVATVSGLLYRMG